MSKYTKALDKIQKGRETNLPSEEPPQKMEDVFSAVQSLEPADAAWLRNIPAPKNIQPDPRVVAQRFPQSVMAEQYRMLRTSLLPNLEKEGARVLMISSSIHSEGKSVTTANLAVALAESGSKKVAVVDADLRRGKIAEYYGIGNKRKGLSNYLTNGLALNEVMVRHAAKNLVVIPRGEIMKNPSELVNSTKFQVFINELRSRFDYVLIDSPPIMSVADAGILGRLADGVLMVIQVGRTPKSVIAHANILFQQAGVKMLGYVLTNVEFQSADYRYYGYSAYEYAYGPATAETPGIKQRTRFQLKRAGWNFKNLEDRFNEWWQRSVLKRKPAEEEPENSKPEADAGSPSRHSGGSRNPE